MVNDFCVKRVFKFSVGIKRMLFLKKIVSKVWICGPVVTTE